MSITPVPISIRLVRAPIAASSGNGDASWRAKWCTRTNAPSMPISSAASASSMVWRSASAAVFVMPPPGCQWPNERKPMRLGWAITGMNELAPASISGLARPDQPAFVCEHDRLHTIAEPLLLQDVPHVRLHGGGGDDKPLCDLRICEARADEAQDLELARAEVEARRRARTFLDVVRDKPREHSRCEHGVARGSGADCFDELFPSHVLEQERARAGAQGVVDVLVEIERRQDDDARVQTCGDDAPRRLDPVDLRHPDVHENDVRSEVASERSGFGAVRRLADHVHAGELEDQAETRPDELLVVREQDADHGRTSGSVARTVKPRLAPAPAANEPP